MQKRDAIRLEQFSPSTMQRGRLHSRLPAACSSWVGTVGFWSCANICKKHLFRILPNLKEASTSQPIARVNIGHIHQSWVAGIKHHRKESICWTGRWRGIVWPKPRQDLRKQNLRRKNISLHRLHHSWFLFCVSGNAATLWEADRSWGRVGSDNSTDPASSHNSSRKLQEPIQPPAWKFQWSPLTLTLYSTLWHTNVLFSFIFHVWKKTFFIDGWFSHYFRGISNQTNEQVCP